MVSLSLASRTRPIAGLLAQDLPGAALLDLCNVELQEAVEPLHEFLPVIETVVSPRRGTCRSRARRRRAGIG